LAFDKVKKAKKSPADKMAKLAAKESKEQGTKKEMREKHVMGKDRRSAKKKA